MIHGHEFDPFAKPPLDLRLSPHDLCPEFLPQYPPDDHTRAGQQGGVPRFWRMQGEGIATFDDVVSDYSTSLQGEIRHRALPDIAMVEEGHREIGGEAMGTTEREATAHDGRSVPDRAFTGHPSNVVLRGGEIVTEEAKGIPVGLGVRSAGPS